MTSTVTRTINQEKADAFVGKVLGDTVGTLVTSLARIGDELGLFQALASPMTAQELAARAGIDGRYAEEWAAAMTCAAYLEYDPASRRFWLPAEHAPVLAQESGPVFFGGVHEEIAGALGLAPRIDALIEAFRTGGGIPQSAYDEHMYRGVERFTAGWFENLLVPVWLPAVPEVQAKLEAGCMAADVGSGHGRALIKLAESYPNSAFVGFDVHEASVRRATENAAAAGVGDRVRFEVRDASRGIPGKFDLITTFDVVHDAVDPQGLLRSIREALNPDGRYLCLEINSADRLEDNIGVLGAFFYSFSVLYCMTTSLAHGGAGLGTAGIPESKMRQLSAEAGFSRVWRVPLENPFNILYEVAP